MPASEPERSARRPLDAAALARVQQRLLSADQPPWLHGEVARRMAERLPVIKLQPAAVIDWGAFLGASREVLASTYPRARITAVEPNEPRRAATAITLQRPWWAGWRGRAAEVRLPPELPAGAGELLWCNMGLHGEIDPQAAMAGWHRVLAVDGFLMFSTLGPGTLQSLTRLYAEAGWGPALAPLVDMHDLGDMLVAAGFADPVMDQETLTLTWATPEALLTELRGLGGNAHPRRAGGLRTPRWRRALCDGLAARAGPDGRIAMDFELVYGHAFRPVPRARVAGRTEVPLDDLREMVRRRPRGV